MVQILSFPSFVDERGALTVIENTLPFSIRRVYYIYDTNGLSRGGHRHKTGMQALICLKGECRVEIKRNEEEKTFVLASPREGLLLEPEDWHALHFAEGAILLVLASNEYSPEDYAHSV